MSDHGSDELLPRSYVKGDKPHVLPMSVYMITIGILFFLTFFTWLTATQLDIGIFNLPLALVIASTKALIVLFIFMHIAWDNKINFVIIISSFVFLGLFFIFPWFDMEGRNMVDVQRSNFKPRDEKVQMHYVNNPAATKRHQPSASPQVARPGVSEAQ